MANTSNTNNGSGPTASFVRTEMLGESAAPSSARGLVAWLRENLFSSIPYTILTLICLYILYVIIPPMVNFLFLDAQFSGTDRAACATEAQAGGTQPDGWFGACWAYIGAYGNQLIYGRYPDAEQWRVNIAGLLFFGGLTPLLMPDAPFKRENLLFMVLIAPFVILILLTGGNFGVAGLLFAVGRCNNYSASRRLRIRRRHPVGTGAYLKEHRHFVRRSIRLAICARYQFWHAAYRNRTLGRAAGYACNRRNRYCRVFAHWYRSGLGPQIGHADYQIRIRRLYRVLARRSAYHGPVHVIGYAAIVPQ